MRAGIADFGLSKPHDDQLFRLAALAEHYFRANPNTCLFKLRQFAELMARETAARSTQLASPDEPFAAMLGALGRSGAVPRRSLDMLYYLPHGGNEATNEWLGDFAKELTGLKVTRELAAWFAAGFGGIAAFYRETLAPPRPPSGPIVELRAELVSKVPADEPASALLERVQAKRAATPVKARRGRRTAA